jgi:SHS2 domain-containing protein
MPNDFEILPHRADLRLKVFGQTKEELFKNAVKGMFQSLRPISSECQEDNERITCSKLPISRKVKVTSQDINTLLVDFLAELLYISDVYNEAYLEVKIEKLTETEIEAEVFGIKVEGFVEPEIKAVTYHEVEIKWLNDHWETIIVFDI